MTTHSRLRQLIGVVSGLTLTLSGAWAQNPSDPVLAAENALYGAGYDIGQADGQMDAKLQSAIEQFQQKQAGLAATGELNDETLYALGVKWDEKTPEEKQKAQEELKKKAAEAAAKAEAEEEKKDTGSSDQEEEGWLFVW